jgi:hypothetical protein
MGFWSEMDDVAAVLSIIGALVATYRGGRRTYRKAIARRNNLPASNPVEVELNPAASVSSASLSLTTPAVITRAAASAHSATSLDLTVGSLA